MTGYSLRPYFHLLHRPGDNRPVADMRADLGDNAFEALCDSGWLDVVPANEALHPANTGGVVAVGAAAAKAGLSSASCAPNERVLLEVAAEWLQMRAALPEQINIGSEIALLGWLERAVPCPVFFARRVAHLESVRQLDALEKRGAAVVLTTTSEASLPSFIVARYSGQSPVRLLPLEDFAEVRGTRALLRAAPAELLCQLAGARDDGSYECDLLTMEGRRQIRSAEIESIRRASRDFDLFADLTTPAVGVPRHFGGSVRHGTAHWSFTLTSVEGAMFREFVSAPRQVIALDTLRCRRALQIRAPLKKFCQMRRKLDVFYERNVYRAFRGYKNDLGRTDRFAFDPPPGFRLAVLVHRSR